MRLDEDIGCYQLNSVVTNPILYTLYLFFVFWVITIFVTEEKQILIWDSIQFSHRWVKDFTRLTGTIVGFQKNNWFKQDKRRVPVGFFCDTLWKITPLNPWQFHIQTFFRSRNMGCTYNKEEENLNKEYWEGALLGSGTYGVVYAGVTEKWWSQSGNQTYQ